MERLIDYIKNARRMGFRDDAIKKRLLQSGEPEIKIDDAFLGAGKPKRQNLKTRIKSHAPSGNKTSHTILLDKWLKDALEKKAHYDGLTLYNEIKKILVENIPDSEIPEGVFMSNMFRPKMTDEEKEKHRLSDMKYKAKVEKERRKLKRARRKRLFGKKK